MPGPGSAPQGGVESGVYPSVGSGHSPNGQTAPPLLGRGVEQLRPDLGFRRRVAKLTSPAAFRAFASGLLFRVDKAIIAARARTRKGKTQFQAKLSNG